MSIEQHIEQHLAQKVIDKQAVGTGLFLAYKIRLDNGNKVFCKYQSSANQQLIHEGEELILLGKTLNTPKVLGSCKHCLILEWIDTTHNPNMQSKMGSDLAKLHQNTNPFFGFGFDNKIGKTPQPNAVGKNINNWGEFYWTYRLLYQIELGFKNKLLSQDEYSQLLRIEKVLPNLLDHNIKPALLHGDLWSGNVLSEKNNPYFIDPACYYGHREMDLALTFMFGGFSQQFYDAYQAISPFDANFNERKPLYMLYHYLNHLNIFGGGYHQNAIHCCRQLVN